MRSGLAPHRAQQERGDDEVAAHARPERDAVAQHRVRAAEQGRVVAAEHLRGDLLRHVEVAVGLEIERRALVDDVAVGRGVHPDRARDDDPARIGAPRRFQHAGDPQGVERDALGRIGDDVVHVGHRREVEHRLRVLDRVGDGVLVEHVDVGPFRLGLQRRLRVDDAHVVAGTEQRVDDVGADEAGTAGDRDQSVAHCRSISVSAVPRDSMT